LIDAVVQWSPQRKSPGASRGRPQPPGGLRTVGKSRGDLYGADKVPPLLRGIAEPAGCWPAHGVGAAAVAFPKPSRTETQISVCPAGA
jgi:hypothetical protein